jgi:hypothetical protein
VRAARTPNEATPASSSLLSAADLARELGKTLDAVDSFLRRYRSRYPDCYMETDGPRRNEPRFLYRVSDVLPALKEHFQIDEGSQIVDDMNADDLQSTE